MSAIRVLLIEENRLLREGLTAMINEQPDIKVVAAFTSGENILARVRELKPQVILLDVGLPARNSLRLVELIKKEFPQIKVIVMDLTPAQVDIVHYVKAGASGFILKDATFTDCLASIRKVAEGTSVLPPALTAPLFAQIMETAFVGGESSLLDSVRMTKREREVIELITEGLSNKEIAQRLHIATHTVKSHVHNILEKLALHSRIKVAAYAQVRRTVTH